MKQLGSVVNQLVQEELDKRKFVYVLQEIETDGDLLNNRVELFDDEDEARRRFSELLPSKYDVESIERYRVQTNDLEESEIRTIDDIIRDGSWSYNHKYGNYLLQITIMTIKRRQLR